MPTGYTAPLYEGKPISFSEFAMRCARGMNYLASMSDHSLDAPIPAKLVPHDYREKEITEWRASLTAAEAMTSADADHAAAWEYEQARRRMTDGLLEMNARRNRLQSMLVQVDAWTPPTPEHEALKQFMLDQLQSELQHCMGFSWPEPVSQSGAQYRAERIDYAREQIARHEAKLTEERRWCDEANAWLAALRGSLPTDATR